MRPPIRILVAAAGTVLVLTALAACEQPAPLPTPTASATPTPSATPGLGVAAIAELARKAIGSGTVVSVEDESDGASYEVHVVDSTGEEQEVHLLPDGFVSSLPATDDTTADERSANRALVAAASVSLDSGVDRMTAAVPGGRVTAIALGQYKDRISWIGDVTARDGVRHDVRIDAVSGAVSLDRPDRQATSG